MSPAPAERFDTAGAERQVRELEASARSWRETSPGERARRVRALRRALAERSFEAASRVAAATRRPVFEVLAQEVVPVLEMCRYCERAMPRWLRPRRTRYLRPGFLRTSAWLIREPLGTVAVVSPANFPLSLALMSAVYLAIAGNTVILKPSERVPDVAALLEELLVEAGLVPGVAAVVQGGAQAARWLAACPAVAKVVFFGTATAGRELAGLCAAAGKPSVLELGGGTTAIVLADANLSRAAAGIAWSAFYARGESCVSSERAYVEAAVWQPFLAHLVRAAGEMWRAQPEPCTVAEPTAGLVRAALAAGAHYLAFPDGHLPPSGPLPPGIVAGVDPASPLLRQELFAPLLAVRQVRDADEAVAQANQGCPMLGASIWSRSPRRARALARALWTQMIWVNDASVGLPNLPWGGSGATGRGALFSRHALDEVTRLKWVALGPASGRRPWWPPYSRWKLRLARLLARSYRW